MQIEDLWKAIEADAAAGKTSAGGWLLRLVRPAAACPFFVGLELASRRRVMLLRLPTSLVPSRRMWPRSKGLEPLAVTIEASPHFGVALKEERFADVFTALVEDLIRRVIEAGTPAAQARAFLGQLARWQKFLSASMEGLSQEAQRGLWGELHFLREHLISTLGPAAVSGWKGAERAHQDFQFERSAVEVKTTLAKQPQVVRITSERQLDDRAWPALFLEVIVLDSREGGAETLPAMVGSLRAKLHADMSAQEQFEEGLLAAGYLDAHASRYGERGYLVRSEKLFRVKRGFPRVTERELPAGVGDVNYGLAIAACEAFLLDEAGMKKALCGLKSTAKRKKRRNNG